jgi:multidrug efflux system membrane fusion protein
VPADLGQSARVFIASDQAVPLAVPLSAVSAENGVSYVWRLNPDSTIKRVVVQLGPYGQESVPVLEGLKDTDWVVAAGVHVLREGELIRPVDRNNRAVKLAARE